MSDQFQKRSNKLDTEEEYRAEVKESLDDISKVVKNYYLSLSPSVVQKIVDYFTEEDLIKILHELSKHSPEDLGGFSKKLSSIVEKKDIKEIVTKLATTGDIPKQFQSEEIKKLLLQEIFENDPNEIVLLNEIEAGFQIEELRYELQKLLVKHLPQDIHSKYDLTFYNLTTSDKEKELIEKQKANLLTPSKFDDYIVEFKLGVIRDYEPEELVYLGKKAKHYATLENKVLPEEINSHLEKLIEDQSSKFKTLGFDTTIDSKDNYSFHQVRLKGSNYNFGYFGTDPDKTEFTQLPVLDNRPVLLLLHGLAQDWAAWRHVIGALRDRYQILVPDMNGFGDSQELVLFHSLSNYASYISNFLKHLGVEKYDLMGHSAGGFTTQQILDSKYLKPEHAVMMSSAPGITLSFLSNALLKFVKSTSLDKSFAKTIPFKVVSAWAKFQHRIGIKGEEGISSIESRALRFKKISPRTMTEILDTLLTDYNITGQKIETSSKCLVVYGTKDNLILPETTKELLKIFDNVEGIEIPGADHNGVLMRLPTEYRQQLLRFLES